MISLTYLSSATTPFDREQLEELLATARANNEKRDVTGMLLYAGGNFIQTLEGEAEVVADLFATIEQDPRHRSVEVMLREQIDARSFEDWSMGFEHVSDEDAAAMPGFNPYLSSSREERPAHLRHSRAAIFYRLFSDFPR